jgi:hypothetical protein
LALAILSLSSISSASATAIYQTSLQVTLSVSDASGGNLQIFKVIDDDGTDPSTTYTYLDPAASLGSDASSSAEVAGLDPASMNFNASTSGQAVGIDPLVVVSPFSTAVTKGGFFLINNTTNPIDAMFTVDWTWSTTIGADNSALDSAVALTNLTSFQDGTPLSALLSELFQSPLDIGGSNSGQINTTLTVDPSGTCLFSVELETAGSVQSTGEAQSIPEPGTLTLLLPSLFILFFFARVTPLQSRNRLLLPIPKRDGV